MMGKASRDKGKRAELEIVHLHTELGIHAERVPLSGASHYQGNATDVDVYPQGKDGAPLCCEIKARANGEGFKTIERYLGEADVLFLRRDRTSPIAILPWRTYVKLVTGFRSLTPIGPSSSD